MLYFVDIDSFEINLRLISLQLLLKTDNKEKLDKLKRNKNCSLKTRFTDIC